MFSIIIPAHNEEKYIARCLSSVGTLNNPPEYEVIVVDNASIDKTVMVAREIMPAAKIIYEPKKGLTIAYNRGAKAARGEILVFVDADNILPPSHLEKIEKEFQKDKKLVAVSGPYVYKDGGKFCELFYRFIHFFLTMPSETLCNRLLNIGASLASGNSAIKKEVFDKVGGFNESIFYGLEPDLTLRLKKIGKVRFRRYLFVESSARRLKKEGILKTFFRYSINTVWPVIFGRPFTKSHTDIR